MRLFACCVVWLVGCGASAPARGPTVATNAPRPSPVAPLAPTPASPAPASPAPLAPVGPPSLPAGRSDAVATPYDPALAAAMALYAQLVATPISLSVPPSDASSGIREIVANIQQASSVAIQIGRACAQREPLGGVIRLQAILLAADAYDVVASRTATASLPLPADLTLSIRHATPAVRADVERQWHERIGAALSAQTRPTYCLAVREYRRALAIDPTHPRAVAQLAAYGDAFVGSCD